MRLPEEANRWKSDGRTIELDLNDPSLALSDTPGDEPTAQRFAAWLRSNGWTVPTEHSGATSVGWLGTSEALLAGLSLIDDTLKPSVPGPLKRTCRRCLSSTGNSKRSHQPFRMSQGTRMCSAESCAGWPRRMKSAVLARSISWERSRFGASNTGGFR